LFAVSSCNGGTVGTSPSPETLPSSAPSPVKTPDIDPVTTPDVSGSPENKETTPPASNGGSKQNNPGEILFDGIPILELMDLPYQDVLDFLGAPIDANEVSWWGIFAEYPDMTLFFPNATNELANFIVNNPKAFDIDGVSMNKTRKELIEIYGDPENEGEIEPYDGHNIIFHIGDYCFWFTLPEEDGKVTSFEIWDMTNEHAGYGV